MDHSKPKISWYLLKPPLKPLIEPNMKKVSDLVEDLVLCTEFHGQFQFPSLPKGCRFSKSSFEVVPYEVQLALKEALLGWSDGGYFPIILVSLIYLHYALPTGHFK